MGIELSATMIKEWFQYRCERKLVYSGLSPDERAAIPIIDDPITSAHADFGNDFEGDVVDRMVEQGLNVRRPAPDDFRLSPRQAKRFLTREDSAQYAHQFHFSGTEALSSVVGVPEGVSLKGSIADLIEVVPGETVEFKVIDIKASRTATIYHRAQIAYYSMLLDGMLKLSGIDGRVHHMGEVWCLPHGDEVDESLGITRREFTLRPYQEMIRDFFRHELAGSAMREVKANHDQTFFHVYFKCEQCRYLGHCGESLPPKAGARVADISAVPGMSHQSKAALLGKGLSTVGKLADAEPSHFQQGGWALRAKGDFLRKRALALATGKVIPNEERKTWLMPPRTDVAIYLVADTDPIEGALATLGARIVEKGSESERIRVMSDPDDELDAIKDVLGFVIERLVRLDQENGEGGKAVAHFFIYEPSEAADLQTALGRYLGNEEVRNGLLNIVRLFPPEELIPEPEYRGIHHLPACALRTVIETRYSLPVVVSYDIRGVSQALKQAGFAVAAYSPGKAFKRPFSSRLSIDRSRALREAQDPTEAERIRDDVRERLETTHSLRIWLEAENAKQSDPFLRLAKGPFQFQTTFDPLGVSQLDALLGLEILENRSGMLATLVELARPADERRDRFKCLANLKLLESRKSGRYQTLTFEVPSESREADLGSFGLILTDGSPDVLLDPQRWKYVRCDLAERKYVSRVLVTLHQSVFQSEEFQEIWQRSREEEWFIDRAFFDPNTERIERFLRYLGKGGSQ